jgi:outer membrane protein TolC
VIAALMLVLQAAAPVSDSLPRVTLAQAISRATRLDPNYVRALGQVDNAEWGRRAAVAAFVLPSITLSLNATKYSTDQFNIGTSRPQDVSVIADATARYELFSGRKFADLGRTAAELDQAEATELQQRFQAALQTEADYYGVLLNQELGRVARERVRRGEEGLTIARARVTAGAAVQSDSLQFVLELTQARLDQLQRDAALTVARLQLGRRVGEPGPVDAVPIDTARAPDLPIGLPEAVETALSQGPQYRAARAAEQAAASALKAERGAYLPTVAVFGEHTRFDVKFFPGAVNVSSIGLGVSLPIWDDGRREIRITQARVNRDVSRAIRDDLERAARRDVTAGFEAYQTAQATTALSETAVVVATENYRVQESRYRAGATTILDVLDAQLRLTQADADLVQSRYAARLALAGLEAILGHRLFTNRDVQ